MLRTVFSRTRKLALMLAALLIVLAATHPSRAMAQDRAAKSFYPLSHRGRSLMSPPQVHRAACTS